MHYESQNTAILATRLGDDNRVSVRYQAACIPQQILSSHPVWSKRSLELNWGATERVFGVATARMRMALRYRVYFDTPDFSYIYLRY